uniref:Uncharacterized protein n=1 Tax=Panagrolaimus davidi TaxID=227884 RepID=A0A914Q254_9BILA
MKLLSIVCIFLVVEFSQQIPFKKNDRLPLPTNDQKGDEIFEKVKIINPSIKDAVDETALNRELKHFDFGHGSAFISSPVKQKGPRINQKISLDAKNLNDKSILLTVDELIDLIVGEATADVIDPEKINSDSRKL